MFLLVLEGQCPEEMDELAKTMFLGDARNRWYDKSFQLIVFENACAGVNVEVTPAQLPTAQLPTAQLPTAQLPPERLRERSLSASFVRDTSQGLECFVHCLSRLSAHKACFRV